MDLLLAFHDGAHFIEKPNPVMVLSGFKSLGSALVLLPREADPILVVTPTWDTERARENSYGKVERAIGSRAGLSLVELPPDDNATLQAGSIYSLRVGASDQSAQHAIVSALVQIHDRGNDLLWPAI